MNEMKTLDEIIKEKQKLSIEQKLNMSLDQIIEHKEFFDEEYYKIESKDLDDELNEYFEIGKLDKELEDYFIISKKIKENKVSENCNEIVEWDYWGVTKTKQDLIEDENAQSILLLKNKFKTILENSIKTKNNRKSKFNKNYKNLIKYYKKLVFLFEKQIIGIKKKI